MRLFLPRDSHSSIGIGELARHIISSSTAAAAYLDYGGFHLHLLFFSFVYQFNSRIGVLVHSSFAND